jgi:hypothetical protein
MTATLLASIADTNAGSALTIATGNISPSANAVLIACVHGSGTNIQDFGISTTLSSVTLTSYATSGRADAAEGTHTWRDQGSGITRRSKLFYGLTGATPGTGTITFSCGGAPGSWGARVWEVTECPDTANNGLNAVLEVMSVDSANTDVNELTGNFSGFTGSLILLFQCVDDEADAVVTATNFTMDTAGTFATPSGTIRGGIQEPAVSATVTPTWNVLDADTAGFIAVRVEMEASVNITNMPSIPRFPSIPSIGGL